jgi:hypothetical protein
VVGVTDEKYVIKNKNIAIRMLKIRINFGGKK